MKRCRRTRTVVAVVALSLLFLQRGRLPAEAFKFEEGDRIVFFGDSITQQHLYTQQLEAFLIGRYPELKLHVINMGWSGNQASDALARFERDVVKERPTVVFVNFGMNDGHYTNFNEEADKQYRQNMRKLVDRLLNEAKARVVLMTTSPVDSDRNKALRTYNTDALGEFAEFLLALGREKDLPVVNQFGSFSALHKQKKEETIGFTVVPDAVHPNARGHLWTTYYTLRQLGLSYDSECVIDSTKKKHLTARNCRIENVAETEQGISFTRTEEATPLYLFPGLERFGDEDVNFSDEINRIRLQITGLPGKRYSVLADGAFIKAYDTEELKDGVNLTRAWRGPWAEAGKTIRILSQQKFQFHMLEWRQVRTGGLLGETPAQEDMDGFREASAKLYEHIERQQREAAKPKPVEFTVVPSRELEIKEWECAGPFHSAGRDPYLEQFGPETEGAEVAWRRGVHSGEGGAVNLSIYLDRDRGLAAYVRKEFEAAAGETLRMRVGSLGSAKVFVNGEQIGDYPVSRRQPPREHDVNAKLKDGRNVVMLKILASKNRWSFFCEAEILKE